MDESDDLELDIVTPDGPDVGNFLGSVTALGGALVLGAGVGGLVGVVVGALVGIALGSVLWGLVAAAVGAVLLGLTGGASLTYLVICEIERLFDSA